MNKKSTKPKPKCYFCNEIATTKEHSPPKCFYPEKKYLVPDSPDYRTNLITVPSCEKHNGKRSADDEYTALSIILSVDNEIAYSLLIDKWMRALKRDKSNLADRVFYKVRPVNAYERRGHLIIPYKTAANTYKIEVINNVIESIARALYYHESKHQNRWAGNCIIKSPNFLMSDLSLSPEYEPLIIMSQAFDEMKLDKKGPHPEIFFYQILQDTLKSQIMKMVFYSSLTFLVIFEPKSYTKGEGFEV